MRQCWDWRQHRLLRGFSAISSALLSASRRAIAAAGLHLSWAAMTVLRLGLGSSGTMMAADNDLHAAVEDVKADGVVKMNERREHRASRLGGWKFSVKLILLGACLSA
jgi:hypothetical protein